MFFQGGLSSRRWSRGIECFPETFPVPREKKGSSCQPLYRVMDNECMNNNKKTNKAEIYKELSLVIVFTVLASLVFHHFDMYDKWRAFIVRYEGVEIDEYFLSLFFLIIGLCWFSYRRWKNVCREIERRSEAERNLQRRDEILETVSYVAERLLQEESWKTGIEEILEKLGKAARVSRVYLLENLQNEKGTVRVRQRFEWLAADIEPRAGSLREFSLGTTNQQQWHIELTEGRVVHGLTDELPLTERILLAENNVKALLFAPVFCGDLLWGSLGFDDCAEYRAWSEAEIDALKTATSCVGAAISKEKSTDALRDREEAYRQLVEYAPAGLCELDLNDFSFLSVNEVMCDYTGYPRGELLRMKAPDLLIGAGKERFLKSLNRCDLDQGTDSNNVYRMATVEGGEIWAMFAANLVYEDGKPARSRLVVQDVTRRKEIEDALLENEKKFKTLFEHIPALSFVLDSEHRRIAVNDVLGGSGKNSSVSRRLI